MARVAVIGAGPAGLVCALELSAVGHDVLVLEASARLGGQLHTERKDGYVVELGAEGFVARSEAVPQVARRIRFADQLIGQSITRSLGYRAGQLRELAPGEAAKFLGFQVSRDDTGQGIRSFAQGMGSFTDALAKHLAADVEIRSEREVASIERQARSFRIVHSSGAAVDAERVVVATSARSAARLLTAAFGEPARALAEAPTLSSVTVSLAWVASDVPHPLDATGFVVATESQEHAIRACTFTTSKFAGRAPDGKVCLRVFIRPDDAELKLLSDAVYVQRATALLGRVLGVSAAPQRVWVSRWHNALPVFDAQHSKRVQVLEQALAGSGIALAGSAFHGAGIDAAVRSALSVSERLQMRK